MARILVVDDDSAIRVAVCAALEKEGHEVDLAGDGDEAIEYFVAMPHDLVITDINMPTKDGVISLLELKADYPDLKLIAISGEREEVLQTAKEFGAKRVIAKPFSPADLLKVVDEVLAE